MENFSFWRQNTLPLNICLNPLPFTVKTGSQEIRYRTKSTRCKNIQSIIVTKHDTNPPYSHSRDGHRRSSNFTEAITCPGQVSDLRISLAMITAILSLAMTTSPPLTRLLRSSPGTVQGAVLTTRLPGEKQLSTIMFSVSPWYLSLAEDDLTQPD